MTTGPFLFDGRRPAGEPRRSPADGSVRPGRGKAWLIRKLGELEIAGSNPAALIP
jgi:hypothetical protein